MNDRNRGAGHGRVPGRMALTGVVLGLAVASGCGVKSVKLVPAEGVVEIGGKPAAGIVIQFLPQSADGEKRPTSFATTDAQGKFRLGTYDGKDGAAEGPHMVLLVDSLEERPAQGQALSKPPRLDSRYATVSGGVTASVVDGGGPIVVAVPAATP